MSLGFGVVQLDVSAVNVAVKPISSVSADYILAAVDG
jgi:hypothetical protein